MEAARTSFLVKPLRDRRLLVPDGKPLGVTARADIVRALGPYPLASCSHGAKASVVQIAEHAAVIESSRLVARVQSHVPSVQSDSPPLVCLYVNGAREAVSEISAAPCLAPWCGCKKRPHPSNTGDPTTVPR